MTSNPAIVAAAPMVVVYAAEDVVWALWIQQIAAEAGHTVRLRRIDRGVTLTSPDTVAALVISANFVRDAELSAEDWQHLGSGLTGPLAVVVGTAELPAEAERIEAVDLRLQPDEERARVKVLRALGGSVDTPDIHLLGQAGRMRVRYPRGQIFFDYQSKSLPRHQREWFYGRDTEIDAIRRCLDDSGAAVLTGMAGSGKTWLATAYLNRFRSQYDLIAWVSGENGAVIRTELGRLAGPLGLPDTLPRETVHLDVVEALRRGDKRYLLVYDNVHPDRYRSAADPLPLPRKPALLADTVPWDGPGHILLTSQVADWDQPPTIPVRMFTVAEGTGFLRRHIPGLDASLAARFSAAVDGSPALLNPLAHRGSRGTDVLDEAMLSAVRNAPLRLLSDTHWAYKNAPSIVGETLRPLVEAPEGSDEWAAGYLLRLLTAFAPDQPIPLSLLTSRSTGDERSAGRRLPTSVADALITDTRRRTVVDLVTQDSIAQTGPDLLTESGVALQVHTVPWHGIRDFLPRTLADEHRHIAHQVLCDADPQRTDLPELWNRYLWLWQQISHTDVLSCPRVARPEDPCAALPDLVGNLIKALRLQGELTAAIGLGLQAGQAWSDLLGPDNVDVMRIRLVTGNLLWQVGRWEEARATAEATRAGIDDRIRYAEEFVTSTNLVAATLRMAGEWSESVAYNEESYAWAGEYLADDNVERVRAGHNLAVAYRMMGRFREALELDAASYERLRFLGGDALLTLHSVNNVARDHRELGEYEDSATLQEGVVEAMTELLQNPRQQHLLRGRKNLALSYRKAGRYDQALELQRAVLTDHIAVYGPEHPESVAARTNVANDYRLTGELDQALEHARDAYRLSVQRRPTHPYAAACAVNYAAVLRELNRVDEAVELDLEAVDVFTERLTGEHPYTLAARTDLAADFALSGDPARAVELGTEVLTQLRRIRGADHPYTLQCAGNLVLDLRACERTAEAEALERDTLDRYLATLGPDHPEYLAVAAGVRGSCDVEPPPM